MSLATRCTECGTVFRVVEDQLKVSDGWVRCGRCSAVFNALDALVDLDAPTSGPAPLPAEAPMVVAAAPPVAPPPPSVAIAADPTHVEPLDALSYAPAQDMAPDSIVAFSANAERRAGAGETAAEPAAEPSFLRAAERAAYWRRPRVRAVLGALSALLALLLLVQGAVLWRDLLAAHWPTLRPTLVVLCEPLNCRIGPLRRVDRLSVDASGLTRVDGAPLHRLSVVLHNRADVALAAPALDLSLTDGQGKLVARRVLQPADLGLLAPTLDAGQELPLQAVLATGERRISGYTLELFYP